METVQAFKCSFCGQLYENEKSCKTHEYRCYFNPITKSCATCAFLKLELRKHFKRDTYIQFQACLVNKNIATGKLKTKCDKYLNKSYSDDVDIMNIVNEGYDIKGQLNEACVRIDNAVKAKP